MPVAGPGAAGAVAGAAAGRAGLATTGAAAPSGPSRLAASAAAINGERSRVRPRSRMGGLIVITYGVHVVPVAGVIGSIRSSVSIPPKPVS